MNGGVKERKKIIPSKTPLKSSVIVKKKITQRSPGSKRRKVEAKSVEKRSFKRKLVKSSDYESDAKANFSSIGPLLGKRLVEKGFH